MMFKSSDFSLLFYFFINGDSVKKTLKQRYLNSAFILLAATVVVKIISAVYKIPLTGFIGAEGRGYFSIAYNLCMPIHALTMGAFPLALTKLVSSCEAKGDRLKIKALRKASKRLFFVIGLAGTAVMIVFAKPYAQLISSSPKSIYTILALAPSVFFSCMCASHRAFAEGFLDMKPTAVSQLIDALFKMIFGLLFAKYSMSSLYSVYLERGTVLGQAFSNEREALSAVYPITSAAAMLGVTLGSLAAYIFAMIYTNSRYNTFPAGSVNVKSACNDLLSFSAALVGATVIQSISGFIDTSSVQYFLSECGEAALARRYAYGGEDVYTYVFGLFATVLDFKNLVPSIVMTLGITAVPAVSAAYESSNNRFSPLLSGIFKYAVILSVLGGLMLSLFSKEMLEIFYGGSNSDIAANGGKILFCMGVTVLPCALATTTVYSVQALGLAKSTIPAFLISGAARVILNYIFITDDSINIYGAVLSNCVGFLIIVIANIITIRKKTNASLSYINIFIKPLACGAVVYFIGDYIKSRGAESLYRSLFTAAAVCVFYVILLFLTKALTLKEKKNLAKL